MKTVYHFNEKGELVNSWPAQRDPLASQAAGHDIFLCPPSGTFEEPPPPRDGFARVWNGESWELVPDFRGREYWLADDNFDELPREMKELGPLPDGALLTPPEKKPEQIAAEKIAALKNERNAAEEAPVEYAGTLWDFDARSRERIMAAIIAMETTGQPSLEWTAADDTSHQLTASDLRAIVAAAALRADLLHKNYRAARDAV